MKEKLYGTVFSKEMAKEVSIFISSIAVDKKLLVYDILGSLAHAMMLAKQKIIPKKDANLLIKGLKKLLSENKKGNIAEPKSEDFEDIHTYINYLLKAKIKLPKEVVDRLHTARSRNDQVALDTRMYCLDAIDKIAASLSKLQNIIYKKATQYKKIMMPAYTHLQPAQVISLGHLLCAYLEMLKKDKIRFEEAKEKTNIMPLGSGAVRGTSLNIDRRFVAKQLGFKKISSNSLEAVSTRDFILEILSATSILTSNLSRIAEDLIIYSTYEFSFVKIDDEYLSGSSMMPNKKNADTLELIRGFSSVALGNLIENISLMNKLPHAYARDMQYDKKGLFESIEGTVKCLNILVGIFKTLSINKERLKNYLDENDFVFATDISEFLIRKGLTYRDAHDRTGKLIKYCLKNKKRIKDLGNTELKQFSKYLNKQDIKGLTDPVKSVKSIRSEGGTSLQSVNKQLNDWRKALKLNA